MKNIMISFLELEEMSNKILIDDILRRYNYERDRKLKAIYSLIYVYYSLSTGEFSLVDISKRLFKTSLELVYHSWKNFDLIGFNNISTKEELLVWLSNYMIGKLITVKKYGRRNKVSDLLR